MKVDKKTLEVWKKNLKQGYRFFEPHNAVQLTPRTEREFLMQLNARKLIGEK